MLGGWAAQELARRLSAGTVAARQRAVRAFAAHAQAVPWAWTAQLADEWFTDLRAVRGLRRGSGRSAHHQVEQECYDVAPDHPRTRSDLDAALIGQSDLGVRSPLVFWEPGVTRLV